jgi:hypothetical protein
VPAAATLHEEAADDGGLRGADVCGGEQLGEAVAEVVDLPVQAPDVAARLLQNPRRRHLHTHTHKRRPPSSNYQLTTTIVDCSE